MIASLSLHLRIGVKDRIRESGSIEVISVQLGQVRYDESLGHVDSAKACAGVVVMTCMAYPLSRRRYVASELLADGIRLELVVGVV